MSRLDIKKLRRGQKVYVLGKFEAEVIDIDWERYTVWCEVFEGTSSGDPERKSFNIYLLKSKRE